ncbi:unnamed protein product [Clonostachys chloroleuca]|uniref:BTB domain-containing protein n=1 Tax=Clonostachys chloroleuca TaxID=1926264 RepID=A0AA35M2N7_9HYPO|nr:unnamed protein product [Clonostachys chloroleuca]
MASATLTEDANKKDASVDIAVNGDVAFIVGPSCRRLRVYSLVLTNASTVFNAMLGPQFKEGHQLAQPGLTEIELPEDNAEAIEIVFNIIHGRNDRVSDTLDPGELLQVAIIIDKYDCLIPLAFAMKLWLKSVSITDPVQMWTLAMVGVVLRREEMFAEATSALVLNYTETYLSLTNMHGELPDPMIQLRIAVRGSPG